MPHPKRLPVTQVFRMLDEQLSTPQRDVAAHLGLSRQAVNNWAKGMSLPQRYRIPFLVFVETKIGQALASAAARSRPTRTLLEATPLDETRLHLNAALMLWQQEGLLDQGRLVAHWRTQEGFVHRYSKEIEAAALALPSAQTLDEIEQAVRKELWVIRTLKRLHLDAGLTLADRWIPAPGDADPRELLWRIYWWKTGDQANEDE